MRFTFTIFVDQGYWKNAKYRFLFVLPAKYPFDPPKVTCIDKVYHPNIDTQGKPCVNVLRPWKPTYSVQIVLFALMFLFTHPNANDSLNKSAADVMRNDLKQFKANVNKTLKGGQWVDNIQYPRNMHGL